MSKLQLRAFLYLGVFTLQSDKRAHGYYDCGPATNPTTFTIPAQHVAPNRLFVKPLFKWGRIGHVYEVEASEEGTANRVKGSAKSLGAWATELIKDAETRHETEAQVRKNRAYAAKLAAKRLSVEDFAAWRREYATCNREGRAAILATIYNYLEAGCPLLRT